MTIVNIRGTSGSGKSTVVHKLLGDFASTPIIRQMGLMKKPKIVGYDVLWTYGNKPDVHTFVVGSYETTCGGCDSMSYKGSHDDIEALVMEFAKQGNVIFEGLTVSSTITRWMRVSQAFPGEMVWAFMDTPEEECHRRILSRNGGKEPKRDPKGIADYNRKFRGCVVQREKLIAAGERVIDISSEEKGYLAVIGVLSASPQQV